jgi:2-polyprenyl-3-methyl-5-hydroxy-6-metoxy-1,4-benzoquinol methylase
VPGGPVNGLRRVLRLLTRGEQRIARLEWQVQRLGESLDFALRDEWSAWLYRNRAERMDASVPFFHEGRRRFHLERYRFAANHVQGRRVADIACGTGYGTELLCTVGKAACAVGVDVDAGAVAYAAQRHGCDGARYVRTSAQRTGLRDESFDVVVSFETLEHVSGELALLEEFSRLLRPGGLLICSTPNQWPLERAEHHVREYDHASFRALLESCFAVEALYNQNSGMPGAPFNRGQPAGMTPTTPANAGLAECFVALCRKPGARL